MEVAFAGLPAGQKKNPFLASKGSGSTSFAIPTYISFLSRGGGRMPEAKTIDLVDLVVRSVNPSLKQGLTHKHLGHQDPEA